MHEFSICQSLVHAVQSELEKLNPAPARLLKVGVAVGKLRQIIPEHLQFAYETLTRETSLEGSSLEVRSVPLTGQCEHCGWKGEMTDTFFECRECTSSKGMLLGGMELYLDNLEIEEAQ